MTTRRAFLAAMAASALTPRLSWADAGSPAFLACAREPSGQHALFGIDIMGHDVFRVPLPGRGHAGAAHPVAPEAVGFARRPGTFALVIDCARGEVLHRLESPEGRHFMGHGTFLQGGAILATLENDYITTRGKIGLWSRAEGYRRIGEIETHGVGPHEALQMKDGTLVVANGGIQTDPRVEDGRGKLNLPVMKPSLAYITPEGELLEQVFLDPELHLNSIRHLAMTEDELVGFAMQWEGDSMDAPPLLGLHRRGWSAAKLAEAPLGEQLAMQAYAGSVALSGDGQLFGITSPRGGRLHLFDREATFVASHHRPDICGLAAGPEGFLATDGLGGVWHATATEFQPFAHVERAWDNHVVTL